MRGAERGALRVAERGAERGAVGGSPSPSPSPSRIQQQNILTVHDLDGVTVIPAVRG